MGRFRAVVSSSLSSRFRRSQEEAGALPCPSLDERAVVAGGCRRIALAAFSFLVVLALASSASGQIDPGEAPIEEVPVEGVEVPGARTETSSTYRLEDGRYATVVSSGPVNFRAEDGSWRPIDNTLVPSARGGFAWENRANGYTALVPTQPGRDPVRFEVEGAWLSFSLRNVSPAVLPTVDRNAVRIAASEGVSVRWLATNTGLKEEIVLANAAAASSFVFDLRLSPGLAVHSREDGGIDFLNPGGERAFSFSAPYMVDSSGSDEGFSSAVSYELEKTDGGYVLRLVADREWLTDPARVWPVTIDPTITLEEPADCHISSGDNQNDDQCELDDVRVGFTSGNSMKRRTLLKFDLGAELPERTITDADLALWCESGSTSNSADIDLRRVSRSWTLDATWNKYNGTNNWTTAGGQFGGTDWATRGTNCTSVGWKLWTSAGANTLAGLVNAWLDGTYTNHGVLLKQQGETTNNLLTFTSTNNPSQSSHWPELRVTFSNTAPSAPTNLSPADETADADATPTLSGTYTDSDSGDTGRLKFRVCVDPECEGVVVNGDGTVVSTTQTSSWTVPADTLEPGATYYWQSQSHDGIAYNGSDPDQWTTALSYHVIGVELREPSRLRANGADLAWSTWNDANGEPFEQYEVHRSASASFTPSAATLVATIADQEAASYSDTTAAPEGTFFYKVVANSLVSNERTVTLPEEGEASALVRMRPEQGSALYLRGVVNSTTCENTGASELLRVGRLGDDTYRSLLAFDLGDIPAEATVSAATLSLWNPAPAALGADVDVYRMTVGWEEGTGLLTCTGDGATWHEADAGFEWTAVGGDYDTSAEVDSLATAGGAARWDEFDLTGLVQEWVSGEAANQGVLLKLSNETLANKNLAYYADDIAASPLLRPTLEITYSDESEALAPTASLVSPAPEAMVSGAAVELTAAASDDGTVEEVEFRVDGNLVDSDTSAPYAGSWDSTAASNGPHTLTLRATDEAGNVTTSPGVDVTVGNSAAPTTSITSPAPSATVTGTTSITANASDDVAVTKVEFYVDGLRLGVDESSPYSLSWNTLSTALPAYDGTHDLTTRAYDGHGQVTVSSPVSVTVANTAATKYMASFDSTDFPHSVLYDPAASPQDEYGIDVTVSNESALTWSSGSIFMRYRWLSPDPTPTVVDGGLVSIGSNLAASGQRPVSLSVPPPTLPTGVEHARYLLRIDMYDDSASTFFAAAGNQPLERSVIVQRVSETALGLERYYQYEGEALGTGMEHMLNVASGNSLVRWTPFQAPGIGLSTVVDLTYNSFEKRSHSPVGNNFSLAVSSLVRFGSPLEIHPTSADTLAGRSDRYIEFTDGDGTTHRFEGKLDGTEEYWEEPAGVHLYLREYPGSDPERAWALTRPDRVTFFFDEDGYPTYVQDGNGNELTFTLEAVPAGENPGGPTKRVTEVTDEGDRSFQLDYYSAEEAPTGPVRGKLQRLTDHTGSALEFDYYEDGNLLRLTQRGGTNADGSFLPDRSFVFTYTTADGSGPAISNPAQREDPDPATVDQSTRLYSVADPRGNETHFTYCSATSCDSIAANQWKLATRTDREGKVTAYAYDPANDLTTITAPLARVTDYLRDAQGSVVEITNPMDETTELEWSADRQLEKVTEPTSEFTEFAYNDNGYLTDTWNQLGERTTLAYENLPVDDKDETGKWKAGRTIPHLSQLLEKTSPKGTMTPGDPDDFDWLFDYDGNGNLTEVADPEDNVTLYTYNGDGTLATTTDPRGVLTSGDPDDFQTQFLDYDENGLPTRIVDAEGGTTRFGYDDDGLLRTIQDPRHAAASGTDTRSYQTTLEYDAFHRPGRQSEPKSTAHQRGLLIWSGVALDLNDNAIAEYGPDYRTLDTANPKLETEFDAMDRPTLLTADRTPGGSTEQTALAYDDAGRLTRVTLPEGIASTSVADDFTNEYVYDALDRVVSEIRYPKDGSSGGARRTHACYDLAGDLRWLTSPRANLGSAPTDCPGGTVPQFTRTYEYDLAHRLTEEVDAEGRVTDYAYNENGNLKGVTNGNGDQTRYQFDELDRVNKIVEPFTDTPDPLRENNTRLEYDPAGNLHRHIGPRAWDEAGGDFPFDDYITEYNYDALNRLVRTDLPWDGTGSRHHVHQAYDANSNPLSTSLPVLTDNPGAVPTTKKTTLTYFDPGWIKSTNDPGNPRIDFDYTAEGWQSLRTPADGERVRWRYFDDGLLQRIDERGRGRTTFAYDRNGKFTRAVDSDGIAGNGRPPIVVCAGYNGFGQVTETRLRPTGDEDWQFTTFAYDRNGNLTDREDNGEDPAADCMDALTNTGSGREHTFTYDDGDWISEQIDQGVLPSDSTDNRRIATTFTAAGQEATRLIERFDGTSWDTKQTTDWTYFQNGKLRTLTTRNKADDIVEDHEVAYIEDGIYLNGHRVTDEFVLERAGSGDCEDPNPCTATYQYDFRDRLQSFANGHGETTTYTLDTAGNVLVKEKTGDPDRTYTYQGDQLITETEAGAGDDFEYFYDAQGNLECVTKLAGSRSDCNAPAGGSISPELVSLANYDPLNRLTSFRTFGVIEPAHIGFEDDRTTYIHDALDRPYEQKERHGPSGPTRTKTFTYLGLTNLLSQEVHTNPGNTKTYGYDAFGHRISMTDADENKTFGYGYDVHGSASLLLDDDQEAPHATYGYDAYGAIDTTLTKGDVNGTDAEKPPEDPLNPYRYTGKRLDSGSASYDMGARRFNAGPARFLQQDLYLGALANLTLSADPLTQNRYALAGGAPTSYIEVDGHGPSEDGGGGAASDPRARARGAIWSTVETRVVSGDTRDVTWRPPISGDTHDVNEGHEAIQRAANHPTPWVINPNLSGTGLPGAEQPRPQGGSFWRFAYDLTPIAAAADCLQGDAVACGLLALPGGTVGRGLLRTGRTARGATAASRVAASVDDVSRSAALPYNAVSPGLSRAGQSLTKHQYRRGPYPQAAGSPEAISRQAQDIVDDVLTNPASTFTTRQTGRFGQVVDIQIPGGPGVRYSEIRGFLHFLEPPR